MREFGCLAAKKSNIKFKKSPFSKAFIVSTEVTLRYTLFWPAWLKSVRSNSIFKFYIRLFSLGGWEKKLGGIE